MPNFSQQSWTPIAEKLLEALNAGDTDLVEALTAILLTALQSDARRCELDWRLVSALNRVANCYTLAREYEKAEEIQKSILYAQKTVLRSGCPEIIDTAMKLCNLAYAKSSATSAFTRNHMDSAA